MEKKSFSEGALMKNFSDICKTRKAKFHSGLKYDCKMPTNTQADLVFAKLLTVLIP